MNKTTELHNLINKERTKRRLPYARWNQGLYRRCKNHSLFMLKNKKLVHAPDVPNGGECCWGGQGSHSPATAVKSWMNSPRHRELILSDEVKSHAIAIVWGRNGTYATWRGSKSLPATTKAPKPPKKTGKLRLSNPFKYLPSIVLGILGLFGIALGIHGIYVYFNRLDLIFGGVSDKFLLMIDVPNEIKSLVTWASVRGLQSWFIPVVMLVAGICLLIYSCLWDFISKLLNKLRT